MEAVLLKTPIQLSTALYRTHIYQHPPKGRLLRMRFSAHYNNRDITGILPLFYLANLPAIHKFFTFSATLYEVARV